MDRRWIPTLLVFAYLATALDLSAERETVAVEATTTPAFVAPIADYHFANAGLFVDDLKIDDAFLQCLKPLWRSGHAEKFQNLLDNPNAGLRRPLSLAPPKRQNLSREQLYAQCRESVVLVGSLISDGLFVKEYYVSSAGGFIVDPSGVICTNQHLIGSEEDYAGEQAMGVMTWDGRVYPVTAVLASDPALDLALLQIQIDHHPKASSGAT